MSLCYVDLTTERKITHTFKISPYRATYKLRSLNAWEKIYIKKLKIFLDKWTRLNFLVSCWYTYWASQGANRKWFLLSMVLLYCVSTTRIQDLYSHEDAGTLSSRITHSGTEGFHIDENSRLVKVLSFASTSFSSSTHVLLWNCVM